MLYFTVVARLFVGAALALAWPAAVNAQQAYPDKPVRLVVPFPPGSGTDIVGRLLAQELSMTWNQVVIVDNRPGASTIVGIRVAGITESKTRGSMEKRNEKYELR